MRHKRASTKACGGSRKAAAGFANAVERCDAFAPVIKRNETVRKHLGGHKYRDTLIPCSAGM